MNKYLAVMLLLFSIIGCGDGATQIGNTSPPEIIEEPVIAIPPPTPEPETPQAVQITIQENQPGFCDISGYIENNHTGFTGDGFANTENQIGAYVGWQVEVLTPGDYEIEIVYATPTDRMATISSNGIDIDLAFVSTTAWDLWSVQMATISLAAGENDITLTASTADGAANIDSFKITGTDLTVGSCMYEEPIIEPPVDSTQLFVIGDSTVANYGSSHYPQTGWGQILQHYFSNDIKVENRARGGRSSRSYYTESGLWDQVIEEIGEGDYVLIQFGHNDRDWTKEERFTPPEDFEGYLANYVSETRAKGATPILVSPMIMNAYNGDVLRNVFTEDGNDYRGSMLKVATDMDVAFVDLNMMSWELVNSLGIEQASHYLYLILDAGEYTNYPDGSNDGTHFQEFGAIEMARLVVEGIESLSSREDIQALTSTIRHRYKLNVEQVGANDSIFTAGNHYPEGIPLTFKTREGDTDSFNDWYNNGEIVSESNLYQMTMPASNYTVIAAFNGQVPVFNFDAVTLFLIGDSTVADYTAGYYPQTGWGQVFQPFFDSTLVTVDNRALGGRSSKSFYNDHWQDVKANIQENDFVFIQFGINDRASDEARSAPTGGVFESFMTAFVDETRALGGVPVFVSTVRRNQWQNGAPYDAYHEHPEVVKTLAAELSVPLIDLDAKNKALLDLVGEEFANRYYYMGLAAGEYENFSNGAADTVHFQEAGAVEMARLVSEGISELTTNQAMAPLVNALKPQYALNITTPTPEAGTISRGFTYPEGVPLTLKAMTNEGDVFTQWLDSDNTQIADSEIYQMLSDSSDNEITAVFNNSEGLGKATTNLVAELDGTHVVLNWDLENFGDQITYLEVYRNTVNEVGGRSRIVAGAETIGSFVDDTVEEGVTYWYMFKVVQGDVTTNTAPEKETRVPFFTEVPVTNLVGVVDGTAIELSWDLKYFDPEITYLELHRNDVNDIFGRDRVVAGAPLTGTARDKDLEPGKTYWYMFKMIQDGQTINTTPEIEVTIPADAVSTGPVIENPPVTNLTTVVNGTSIKVKWNLQNFTPDITYLEVYRNDKNQAAGRTRIVAGAELAGEFIDEGLESGKTYWYMFKMTQDGGTTSTDPEGETTIRN